jgi:hypothetical protein
MKKRFLGFVNFIFCLSAVLINVNTARAGAPVVHISPKPTWLSACKPYDKQPSLRTIEGGFFFENRPIITTWYGRSFRMKVFKTVRKYPLHSTPHLKRLTFTRSLFGAITNRKTG